MKRSQIRLFSLVAFLAVAGSGCADQTTPFESIAAPNVRVGGPFLSLSPITQTVQVLERTEPLEAAAVATKVIGSDGGVIELREAGLTLTIPSGALAAPTQISVRAEAGPHVAYTFQPHGTRFSRVVTAEQSLAGTVAEQSGASVSARGYFTSADAINEDTDRAVVSELSLVEQDASQGVVRFYLNHFSGYLVAID
jgi:ZU5 domain